MKIVERLDLFFFNVIISALFVKKFIMPLPQQPGDEVPSGDGMSQDNREPEVSPEVAFIQAKMTVTSDLLGSGDALRCRIRQAEGAILAGMIDDARNHLAIIYGSLTRVPLEESCLSDVLKQNREPLLVALFDAVSGRDGAYAAAVAAQAARLALPVQQASETVEIVGRGEFMQEAAFQEVGEQ